jgi:hypothetical protein
MNEDEFVGNQIIWQYADTIRPLYSLSKSLEHITVKMPIRWLWLQHLCWMLLEQVVPITNAKAGTVSYRGTG